MKKKLSLYSSILTMLLLQFIFQYLRNIFKPSIHLSKTAMKKRDSSMNLSIISDIISLKNSIQTIAYTTESL